MSHLYHLHWQSLVSVCLEVRILLLQFDWIQQLKTLLSFFFSKIPIQASSSTNLTLLNDLFLVKNKPNIDFHYSLDRACEWLHHMKWSPFINR